jgi:hypothetical protein
MIKLTGIKKIIAYKLDLITWDEIRMDIIYMDGSSFTISEDDEKIFGEFIRAIENDPKFDRGWKSKVYLPAFARNETVVLSEE